MRGPETGLYRLVEDTRGALRKSRYLRYILAARRAHRLGLRLSATRYRLLSSILGTAPCPVSRRMEKQDVEVHLVCYWRDYLLAVWALKTFYRLADVDYPLTVHIDGFATRRMITTFTEHFPGVTIVRQEEADQIVLPILASRGLYNLLAERARNVFVRKLLDIHLLAQRPHTLMMDSDVLFFQRPTHLLDNTLMESDAVFMRDCSYCYTAPLSVIERVVGRPIARYVNGGMGLIRREALDLQRIEDCLRHPEMTEGDPTFLEQTLYAVGLCASRVSHLPSCYVLSMKPDVGCERMVARHYAGDSRELMTNEGITHLIGQGFLTAV